METLPTTLGSYVLIHHVAQGAFAYIYLALKENRPVLVKCLRPERASDPRAVNMFRREVKIASRLCHPNIVSVIDTGKVGSTFFSVMDFHVALSADQLSSQQKIPPLRLSLYILKELLKGLTYLHETTIFEHSNSTLFHGDLSPANILLLKDGSVRLTDFGSAGQTSFADPMTPHFGKLAFLPFEITENRGLSPATDVYSLAVLAFFFLFGRMPFEGKNTESLLQAIRRDPVPRLDCRDLVRTQKDEAALRIVFNQALHKNPNLRFKTIRTFSDAFFHVGFRVSPAAGPQEALGLFPLSIQQSLKNLQTSWKQQIGRFQESSRAVKQLRARFSSLPVEKILARQDIRRYPRVAVPRGNVSVEVLSPTQRVKSRFAVRELGLGGLLLDWRALPSQTGEAYSLVLQLQGFSKPLKAGGEIRYEISHHRNLYVGMRFTQLAEEDRRILEAFIRDRLISATKESPDQKEYDPCLSNAKVLEVLFRTPEEWKTEVEQNLRHGGIFIRTCEPHENDESVIIRIIVPQQETEFYFAGKIVSCSPLTDPSDPKRTHGVGVALRLTGEQKQRIETSISQLFPF